MPIGTITISWRNGDDEFCISRIKDVLQLEEKCECGIYEIAQRLASVLQNAALGQLGGRAHVNDIRETIRIGLIGGGKEPAEANKIVAACVDGRPLAHSVSVAFGVVQAYLIGVPDDPLGKAEAAGETTAQTSTDPMAASAAPSPTETALQ